ncbi:MAG: hypothetical protein ABSE82_04445 [Nitrososphaerales archaeon]|jgi:hypothetical protein
MSNAFLKNSLKVSKVMPLLLGLLLLFTFFTAIVPLNSVSAQTQYVAATPGYINLGLGTNITVTSPAAGSYNVVVQKPSGLEVTITDTFTSAGQVKSAIFGISSSGFSSQVNQVGTYNVFLEQSGTVVSSTSFYATNKLNVVMDMVTGGTCLYIGGETRGAKLIPRFHVTYASTGGPVTNSDQGISVIFTAPGNVKTVANWDGSAGSFNTAVSPTWNYTFVGAWNPTAVVNDTAGNSASYTYTGSPYVISPATLSTTIQLVDSKTNQTITSIANGENVTIYTTISYPTNAEPVSGFVAPLDSAIRGGVVTGLVGYGTYNVTSKSFNEKNSGQIANVALTYTGKNGIWTASFSAGTLPTINSSQTFKVVINSVDKASPPNTGSATLNIAPTAAQVATSATSTQSSSSSQSSATTSTTSSTVSTSIPVWAYAGTTIALIIGVIVGFLARKK